MLNPLFVTITLEIAPNATPTFVFPIIVVLSPITF